MSLDRYAASAGQHAQELLAELTEQDVQAVRQLFEKPDAPGWDGVVEGAREEALRLLAQTPAQRKKRLARKSREERILLILSAAYLALEAQQILEQVERHLLWPGGGYRVMTAAAASAGWYHRRNRPFFWPLDAGADGDPSEEDG